ncbi:carboxylate--amine ligase [Clostridiaceae bacterium M8S5]|nr:carboxylate--amine ligase [Clostridiaceae bacterium M8S5]
MKNKAVVLGANYYIGLSIIRCLGTKGIHVTAIDYSKKGSYAFSSKYCSEILIAPHYKKEPKAYLDFLIDYSKKQEFRPVLFPSADPYVEFVDEYLDILSKYYLIPQTKKGLYSKVMNKDSLARLAKEHDVLVPETIEITDDNYIENVEKYLKYPCLIKPADSASFVAKFRTKMFKVNNRNELLDAVDKAKNAKLDVIAQRIIPGFDDHMYTFDAYLDQNSKVTHWVTCQKYRQYPVNFGASVYTTQKYVPELYDIGSKFLEAIGYKGFAEIEFKKDAVTGKYYLIEVNVRISNLNTLLNKTGVNMPYLTYADLTGNPEKPFAVTDDTNIVFWYAYEDLLAVRNYIKTKQLSIGKVFGSYFRRKACAIWDIKDPKPAFSFLKNKASKIFNKTTKKS